MLLGLVVALGVAEGAVRLAMAASPQLSELFGDPMAVQIEPHGEHGYRPRAGATLTYANGTTATANARHWRGPLVTDDRQPNEVRVVLLGGSTTHGWGVNDDDTIDAALRRALAAAWPGRPVRVINLGYDGYDSWQDWERWRTDGVPLSPDVVVIHSGINDVRNARWPLDASPDPRTLMWEPVLVRLRAEQAAGGPGWRTRLKHWVALVRVPGAIRDRLRARAGVAAPPTTPFPQAAEQFAANVQRIAADARSRGVHVLMSTPPSALAFFPGDTTSTISYWVGTAATTQRVRDSLDARLQAIAAGAKADARPALRYVPLTVARSSFLDDCHLTAQGNAEVAASLAAAIVQVMFPASARP
jgi:lysophospholipase L1-like esterase